MAKAFGSVLRSSYANALVRYEGFRTGTGAASAWPASYGLANAEPPLLRPPGPIQAGKELRAWHVLGLGSRFLAINDVSAAMATPDTIRSGRARRCRTTSRSASTASSRWTRRRKASSGGDSLVYAWMIGRLVRGRFAAMSRGDTGAVIRLFADDAWEYPQSLPVEEASEPVAAVELSAAEQALVMQRLKALGYEDGL